MINLHKNGLFIKTICMFFILLFSNLFLYSSNNNETIQEYSKILEQGEKFRQEGQFKSALEMFIESLDLAYKISDENRQLESLLNIGLMYWNLGELEESNRMFEKAKLIAQKLDLTDAVNNYSTFLKIYDLYKKGREFRHKYEYEKSTESYENAIELARKSGSKEHELKCLRQLSVTYDYQNKLKELKECIEQALRIARTLNHRKEQGRCLISLGIYYYKINNYSEALDTSEEALKAFENTNSEQDESICLTLIGNIYQHLGNADKALEYYNKALAIDQKLKDDYYISYDFNNIGTSYRTKGLAYYLQRDHLKAQDNYYKALDFFKKSLEITEKLKDTYTQVEVLNNIGTIYSDLERYSEALKYFHLGYDKAEEISNFEVMGMTLTNIGYVHYNLENFEEAAKYNERAINIAIQIEGGQILWEAYLEIAKAYEKQNKINDAIINYKLSIETTEKIRSRIILEELKSRFLGTDKRIEAYQRLIHLFVSQSQSGPDNKYYKEAFSYLERAKARAFLDSIELSQVDVSQGIDAELLNREKELMNDITQIYSKLLAAELSPEEKSSLSQNLGELEDKLEALKREIRKESPAYANFKYPEIITLDETQKSLLDANTAIFAYSVGQENSYAFAVTKKELRIFPLPSRDEIQNQVSDYLRIITDKDNHNFEIGYELFNHLVFPGLDKDIKKIIFVPDGILHFLPFETLLSNTTSNSWLIRDYAIAYAPSISSLREIIKRKKSSKKTPRMDLLAFGDPSFGSLENGEDGGDIFQDIFPSRPFNLYRLEYSGVEIDRISSLFKKNKRNIFRRKEATEDQVKTHKLDDYKIIHFATHSIIDERNPDRSSIVLTLYDDLPEDGILQMREVYTMNLNSDIVTLSSCQTGLGEFIRGEGIEGINRAFFYAGASSVLMSLWAINDQASYQLMERFYTHLRSSNSIMDALQKAKLEMIESDVLSHPYYWAGFIASGKTDEVIFQSSLMKGIIFGIIFALVFGVTFILVRKFSKKA